MALLAELVDASRLRRDDFGHEGSNPLEGTMQIIKVYGPYGRKQDKSWGTSFAKGGPASAEASSLLGVLM